MNRKLKNLKNIKNINAKISKKADKLISKPIIIKNYY